jgi:hypothetical protein
MTNLTRRSVLTGAVAAGATALAPFAPTPVRAAAPLADKQAAGFYRYKVGSFEVTVITDGANRMQLPADLVANATKDQVNAQLAAAYMDKDVFVGPYNPIVVNTGAKLVLIDTGTGEAAFNQSKGATGQLLSNMAAAGIDPKAIDAVIISHYHGDHVNGLCARTVRSPSRMRKSWCRRRSTSSGWTTARGAAPRRAAWKGCSPTIAGCSRARL